MLFTHRIIDTGTDFKLNKIARVDYWVSREKVYLWKVAGSATRILDRQTLELNVMAGRSVVGEYECEVMQTAEAYFAELERRIDAERAKADALMKRNKI